MSSRARIILIVVVGCVALVAAGFILLNVLRDDAPAAFELSSDQEASTGETDTGATSSPEATPAGIEGEWIVGTASQAGYRVVEDFIGGIQDFEAVGRTDEIEGSLTIEGTMATAATFTVDVASISSDDSRRDGQFRNRVMNTAEFPTATFELTEPIDFGPDPSDGEPIAVSGAGALTLRDVTRPVTVEIQAQQTGEQIEVVGSIDILFSDFEIDNPSVERVISVRDEGLVEFQLFFVRP